MTTTACLQLEPARIETPVVGHAPTLDYATVGPEIGPGREVVNIGEGCQEQPFGVGNVTDLDEDLLQFRFFMLFADPSQGELAARQEIRSGTLVPLEADPRTFEGPIVFMGRTELAQEFRLNSLAALVTTPEDPEDKLHALELVIADRPFGADPDDDTLPEGTGQTRVAWDFVIYNTCCLPVPEDCAPPVIE